MQVTIPDDIVRRAQANALDVRLAVAIQFYADNRIDHDEACRLAGMAPVKFNRELLERKISVQQYPAANFRPRRSAG